MNPDLDMNGLQLSLNAIEASAYSTLPSEEASIVLGAVSVARNSSYYWDANLEYWRAQLNGSGQPYLPRTNGRVSWGWVAGMDVTAAVIVGVGNSPALAAVFIGWAYWTAIPVGAAVITSGATAIITVLNSSYTPNINLHIPTL